MGDQGRESIGAVKHPFREVYSVSRLNNEARSVLERNFPPLWIEGELSNLARPRSGHLYFSLKDESSQVRCAMFRTRNRNLDFIPEDGMLVLLHAKVSLYAERGDFQLIVEYMEEAGAGALRRAFDALKHRLSADGLFDAERKKPLPSVPSRIGIITSPTGAALRDILTILKRRFPAIPALIYPTPVQGPGAAEVIARMIALADERSECDVIVLARGGGSLEDLWAFNEEIVARAIDACSIPVVTGIGHEIDFTIADFCADQRAATPSAAAELVAPDQIEWRQRVLDLKTRSLLNVRSELQERRQLVRATTKRLRHPRRRLLDLLQRNDELFKRLTRARLAIVAVKRNHLKVLRARLLRYEPSLMVTGSRGRLEQLSRRLRTIIHQRFSADRARASTARRALEVMGPLQTLARGYAIVSTVPGQHIVRSTTQTHAGAKVNARLAEGSLSCTVEEVNEP